MKIQEKNTDNSMRDIIYKIIKKIFKKDVEDDELDEIVDRLKLSDMLWLGTAYEDNDIPKMARILGIPLELDEYSMGGDKAVSAASNRPLVYKNPSKNTTQQSATNNNKPKNKNTSTNQKTDNNEPDDKKDDNIIEASEWLRNRAGIK